MCITAQTSVGAGISKIRDPVGPTEGRGVPWVGLDIKERKSPNVLYWPHVGGRCGILVGAELEGSPGEEEESP